MTDAPPPASPPKKPRGCLFFAAVAAAVFLAASVLAAGLLVYYARGMIIANTDSAPTPLSGPEMPDAGYEDLEKRVEAFRTSLRETGEIPELVLSADDINALIARKSPAERYQDMLRVTIDGDKMGGQVSLPLDKAGLPLPGGRYLNGAASFKVSMKDGVLIITADSLSLKGKAVPPSLMAQLKNENLARNAYRDPRNAEALRRIESIEVKDGRITIKPRRG